MIVQYISLKTVDIVGIQRYTTHNRNTPEGQNTMKNTTYTFITKDGKRYSHGGNNRLEAQHALELAFRVDLTGSTFQEVYKLRVVRTGTVR